MHKAAAPNPAREQFGVNWRVDNLWNTASCSQYDTAGALILYMDRGRCILRWSLKLIEKVSLKVLQSFAATMLPAIFYAVFRRMQGVKKI
jgi:hypothetical protein